ncbi:hypothetical protein DIPPA_05836 [Diplonema papillatum]|nr:hypothetical protein DIPPA_05836 [Diplonema papillatum]
MSAVRLFRQHNRAVWFSGLVARGRQARSIYAPYQEPGDAALDARKGDFVRRRVPAAAVTARPSESPAKGGRPTSSGHRPENKGGTDAASRGFSQASERGSTDSFEDICRKLCPVHPPSGLGVKLKPPSERTSSNQARPAHGRTPSSSAGKCPGFGHTIFPVPPPRLPVASSREGSRSGAGAAGNGPTSPPPDDPRRADGGPAAEVAGFFWRRRPPPATGGDPRVGSLPPPPPLPARLWEVGRRGSAGGEGRARGAENSTRERELPRGGLGRPSVERERPGALQEGVELGGACSRKTGIGGRRAVDDLSAAEAFDRRFAGLNKTLGRRPAVRVEREGPVALLEGGKLGACDRKTGLGDRSAVDDLSVAEAFDRRFAALNKTLRRRPDRGAIRAMIGDALGQLSDSAAGGARLGCRTFLALAKQFARFGLLRSIDALEGEYRAAYPAELAAVRTHPKHARAYWTALLKARAANRETPAREALEFFFGAIPREHRDPVAYGIALSLASDARLQDQRVRVLSEIRLHRVPMVDEIRSASVKSAASCEEGLRMIEPGGKGCAGSAGPYIGLMTALARNCKPGEQSRECVKLAEYVRGLGLLRGNVVFTNIVLGCWKREGNFEEVLRWYRSARDTGIADAVTSAIVLKYCRDAVERQNDKYHVEAAGVMADGKANSLGRAAYIVLLAKIGLISEASVYYFAQPPLKILDDDLLAIGVPVPLPPPPQPVKKGDAKTA